MALPSLVELKPGAPTDGWWEDWVNPPPIETRDASRRFDCEEEPYAGWHSVKDNRDKLCKKANELKRKQQALEKEVEALKSQQQLVEAQETLVEALKVEIEFQTYINSDESTKEAKKLDDLQKKLAAAEAHVVTLKKEFMRKVEEEEDGIDFEFQRQIKDNNLSPEDAKKVVPNADGDFSNNYQANKWIEKGKIDEGYEEAKQRRRTLNAQAAAQAAAAAPARMPVPLPARKPMPPPAKAAALPAQAPAMTLEASKQMFRRPPPKRKPN